MTDEWRTTAGSSYLPPCTQLFATCRRHSSRCSLPVGRNPPCPLSVGLGGYNALATIIQAIRVILPQSVLLPSHDQDDPEGEQPTSAPPSNNNNTGGTAVLRLAGPQVPFHAETGGLWTTTSLQPSSAGTTARLPLSSGGIPHIRRHRRAHNVRIVGSLSGTAFRRRNGPSSLLHLYTYLP